MNSVNLIGRLTREVEVKYTQGTEPVAMLRNTVAIERVNKGEKQTDFIPIVIFGKQAENCEKYVAKGNRIAIQGRIQTGKYENREGQTVYTIDVIAERVEFIDFKDKEQQAEPTEPTPPGYSEVDDDVPF